MTDQERRDWRANSLFEKMFHCESEPAKKAKIEANKLRKENLQKYREYARISRERNPEKHMEKDRKYREANRAQAAADQFFQLAGAAQELTKLTANG